MRHDDSADGIDLLIDKVDRLHSGPRIAQRIVALTREPEFDMRKVVECLEHDPALSARILSVVNSSRYGLAQNISSVRHAATFLGRRSLRLIVLTFSLVENLAKASNGRLYSDYWRRALTMAHVAMRLARLSKEIVADEAYTSGLLADVGVLVMAQVEGERYRAIYERCPHGPALLSAEQSTFGFSHPMLGARLLKRWQLPDSVVEAVGAHHDEAGDGTMLNLAVRAGDLMADALWTPESPKVAVVKELLQREFNHNLDAFIELALCCRKEVEESAAAFGINVAPGDHCEQLLVEARRLYSEVSLEVAIEMDTIENAFDEISG